MIDILKQKLWNSTYALLVRLHKYIINKKSYRGCVIKNAQAPKFSNNPTHEMIIFTKFHKDREKMLIFYRYASFMIVHFFLTPPPPLWFLILIMMKLHLCNCKAISSTLQYLSWYYFKSTQALPIHNR